MQVRKSSAKPRVCLSHSVISLSPKCGALLEGIQGRCRNIDFVIPFYSCSSCQEVLNTLCMCPWEWERWRKPRSFFPTRTAPKAPTGHISAVHVNNVRRAPRLTGQEEIPLDHILGRLYDISSLKYADIFHCLKIVPSGSRQYPPKSPNSF